MATSFKKFLDHTHRWTTVGRTSLDEFSDLRSDLHLTTQNFQQGTDIHALVGFELTIPAGEPPKTHILHHTTTGIGRKSKK
jgi:hypothetical protein